MPPDTGEPSVSTTILKEAYSSLLTEIVEDITLELCFKIHRAMTLGYFAIDEYIVNKEGKLILYDPAIHEQDYDMLVYAANTKKPSHIICPHCHRKLGTNRFAPHLNSCMNDGGRQNKDRSAKRTCQNLSYDSNDDDDDEDYSDSGRRRKKKTTKNSRRNPRSKKPMNVNLAQKCGVISLKTKTMCQNTLKCSMHSDEARREVRRLFQKSSEPEPNVHIDVDTVEDVSRSPSPSDFSLDSNNSTLSVKLEDICSTPEHPRLTPSSYS